ncbi:hypothetical protein C8R45DRAFT_1109967 [Mycena sanguinolenta]|nr:hypothetical protein C8R45DRAFT_1109967 [Mycena sanguinolenta]
MTLAHHLGIPIVFRTTPCNRRLDDAMIRRICRLHHAPVSPASCVYHLGIDSRYTTTSTRADVLWQERALQDALPFVYVAGSSAGDGAENEIVDGKDARVGGAELLVMNRRSTYRDPPSLPPCAAATTRLRKTADLLLAPAIRAGKTTLASAGTNAAM